jgi:hypothetical protein
MTVSKFEAMVAAQLLSGRITNYLPQFVHAFAQSQVFLLKLVEKLAF